jgi:predicted TIM-barrel fold metal-dependent hydrolase
MFDCHAHILTRDTDRFPPAGPTSANINYLKEHAFESSDLLSAMDENGVEGGLIVQRGQFYGADNRYVLWAAQQSMGRLSAVCALNSMAPDCATVGRELLAQGAVGLRLMGPPQHHTIEWLNGGHARSVWGLCASEGIPLCVHLFAAARIQGLHAISALLKEFPVPALVIDHLANGPIESDSAPGIDDALRLVAESDATILKFTTIPLGQLKDRGIDAGLILEAYIALVGPDRLIWGSDITQSRGTYPEQVALARDAVATIAQAEATKLLGANARRIYLGA